jgi:hypothetical protein
VDEPLAELAAYFRWEIKQPDRELIRLAAAARADGSRRDGIAAAWGIKASDDLSAVIFQITGETGAELLLSATQYAIEQLTGSQRIAGDRAPDHGTPVLTRPQTRCRARPGCRPPLGLAATGQRHGNPRGHRK